MWGWDWSIWMQSKNFYINNSLYGCWYDSIECSPKTVISTPARVSVDMNHLEGVEVEIALCGFIKQSISLLISWCFLSLCYISLGVTENFLYFSVLYCIKTMGSRWHHVRVCFSSSGRTIVILKLSQLHQIYFHLRNCPMYVACCQA